MKLAIIFVSLLLFAACTPTQANTPSSKSVITDESLVLWSPHGDGNQCMRSAAPNAVLKHMMSSEVSWSTKSYGYKWPERDGYAPNYIRGNNSILDSIVLSELNNDPNELALDTLKSRLLNGASNNAFTRLDFEGPGGPSPSFMQAILVKNLAYSTAVLVNYRRLNIAELDLINVWVQKLMSTMGTRASSIDHRAAIITAKILWGAASKNRTDFDNGIEQLKSLVSKANAKLEIGRGLRNNNEVMHQLILAAEVAQINGLDPYSWPAGNSDLEQAISKHIEAILENGDKPLKTSGDPLDKARSIFNKTGFGTHIAWVPILLSNPRIAETLPSLKAVNDKLNSRYENRYRVYDGMQIGITTGCYFKVI